MRLQKITPPLRLRVFVEDITAFLMEKNDEVAENDKEGDEEAKRRSRENRPQIISQ